MFLDVTLQKREKEKEEPQKVKMAYDWRFENSINNGNARLDVTKQEFKYEKWRTNSSLSNFLDTIMYSNEMNLNYDITDQMHYDYLFYSVRKKKRYGSKKSANEKELQKQLKEESDNIALISEYYKYNISKSKSALKILTKAQIDIIKRKLEKG
jgi:hypothetical protein